MWQQSICRSDCRKGGSAFLEISSCTKYVVWRRSRFCRGRAGEHWNYTSSNGRQQLRSGFLSTSLKHRQEDFAFAMWAGLWYSRHFQQTHKSIWMFSNRNRVQATEKGKYNRFIQGFRWKKCYFQKILCMWSMDKKRSMELGGMVPMPLSTLLFWCLPDWNDLVRFLSVVYWAFDYFS